MGIFYDLGRPVVGGWMGGGLYYYDPVRRQDLIWAGEFGQEGAVLFAIDAMTGVVTEKMRIGAREFGLTVEVKTGRLWIHNSHGLYQPGNMLQSWDPRTRRLAYHGFPPIADARFTSGMWGNDGNLYLGTHPNGHLVVFDPVEETWRDYGCQAPEPLHPGQQIWCNPLWMTGDEVICSVARTRPGHVVACDTRTGNTRLLSELPPRPVSPPPAHTVSMDFENRTFTFDGTPRPFYYKPCVASDICGLNLGPDGKIYGSTIISMHLFSFNPETRQLCDLGRVGWGSGEVYDVIAHDGKMYMGSYTGAYWGVYDPAKPWNPRRDTEGMTEEANPRCLGKIGHNMNRPFEYAVGPDDRIYIACRANYGITGGGLGLYDPSVGSLGVYRDPDQSVQCVTADRRFVYGGTSMSGGRGCVDTTTEARLFVFDPRTQRRIYTCIPVSGAMAVTSLAVGGATGLVYGSTSTSELFAFCPDRRQVVGRWRLRSSGTPLMGVPETYGIIHLTPGSDGNLYGVTRTDVFKLDTHTDRIEYLDTPPIPDLYQIVEGSPGVFYIGARGHLLEYHLKDTPHYR
ncbi:MAG: hypothetical protein FJY97_04735 [candidate division Zixibacteria bacterium]|nr:hypothetical protein [candidate division Zixibacteria bacterium]